jgi:hypothetical protein
MNELKYPVYSNQPCCGEYFNCKESDTPCKPREEAYANYGSSDLGPSQQQWGSKPVGGPGTSATLDPKDVIPSIESQANRMLDELIYAVSQVIRRAISRAEEQGYKVGFDAATEAGRETLARLEAKTTNQARENQHLTNLLEKMLQIR